MKPYLFVLLTTKLVIHKNILEIKLIQHFNILDIVLIIQSNEWFIIYMDVNLGQND